MDTQRTDTKMTNPEEFVELKPIIRPKDIIENVESFIQHLRSLDYVVDKSIRGVSFEGRYLFDILAVSMSNYEMNKDDPTTKWMYAKVCLKWINTAFAVGAIKEGEGAVNKYKELSEENTRLKKELEIVSNELMRAKERIEEFELMYPSSGNESA